jgi:hypothetical protein
LCAQASDSYSDLAKSFGKAPDEESTKKFNQQLQDAIVLESTIRLVRSFEQLSDKRLDLRQAVQSELKVLQNPKRGTSEASLPKVLALRCADALKLR